MKTAATLVNIAAFLVLFFDYAVAMKPVQPAGMRRTLQIYAGQLPTGSYPTLKPVWDIGAAWSDNNS
jgi:hypothetical protein